MRVTIIRDLNASREASEQKRERERGGGGEKERERERERTKVTEGGFSVAIMNGNSAIDLQSVDSQAHCKTGGLGYKT